MMNEGNFQPTYSAQGPEEPPKKSKTPVIIIAVVLVICLIVAIVMMVRGSGKGGVASDDARAYLQAAIDRTFQEQSIDGVWPDTLRFADKPQEFSMSGNIRSLPDLRELEGASAELILKTDQESFLLDLSVGYAGISLRNNQLYLSDSLLAIRLPDLLPSAGYITFDTNTFIEDWNSSPYGLYAPIDPDELGLDMMASMFDSMSNTGRVEQAALTMVETIKAQSEQSLAEAKLKEEGKTTITVNGRSVEAEKFVYELTADQAKELYVSSVIAMREYMDEYMSFLADAVASEMTDMGMDAEMDQLFDELGKISFPKGMQLVYYVDPQTGYVVRAGAEKLQANHEDYPPSDIVTIDVLCDLYGDPYPTNAITFLLSLEDSVDSIEMGMDLVLSSTSAPSEFRMYMTENGKTLLEMVMSMGWDPSSADMKIDFSMGVVDEYSGKPTTIAFESVGKLYDNPDAVEFQDGVITIWIDNAQLLAMDFDFALRTIDASEVAIDQSQTTSFFELDMAAIQGELMSALMVLSQF